MSAVSGAAKRLRAERERLEKSQKAFAALVGISKNTQLAYEGGGSAIPLDYLERLEQHGLDVGYVVTGRRQPPVLTTNLDEALTQRNNHKSGSDRVGVTHDAALAERFGLKLIPEVEITYSLGGGALGADHPDTKMVPFRQDWLERLTRGFKADVFLARGQGDSMMPTILDDDDVLVNRADNVVMQQDRIWALGYGELGMIKRVRRLPSGQFQLNSDNPAVSPIEATEDELFVVGRVIWIGRRV